MSFSFRLEGVDDAVRNLDDLSKATQRNVLRRVLRQAGEPVADLAQRLAPRLSGRTAASVIVSFTLNRTQAREARNEGRSFAEVYVGTAWRNATPREFGSWRTRATPFMRPAWDSLKASVKVTIEQGLIREVMAAAARAERRAARRVGG